MATVLQDPSRRVEAGVLIASVLAVGVLTLTLIEQPLVALALLAAVIGAAVILRPVGRLAFISLGGLFVLQSESTAGKLGYLAGAAVVFGLALLRLPSILRDRPDLRSFRPLLIASAVLGVYMVATLVIAGGQGTSVLAWARDAAPYLLIAAMPVIALDAAVSLSPRLNERLLLLIGVLAAISFMVDWANRRSSVTLGTSRVALASFALCALLFCYAITRAGTGQRRAPWAVLALLVPGAVLVTGTRSALLFFVAVVGVMGGKAKSRINPLRLAGILVAVVLVLLLALPLAAGRIYSDPTFFQRRVQATTAFITGNSDALQYDQSYELRQIQYDLARVQISAHPLLGTGPGFKYRVPFPDAEADTFTLDTPYITPAKLGILGTFVILGFVAAFGWSVLELRRARGYSPGITTTRAFGLVSIGSLPFGSFVEDKGAALAVLLLIAVLASEKVTPSEQNEMSNAPATAHLLPTAQFSRSTTSKVT